MPGVPVPGPVEIETAGGDVLARFQQRAEEFQASVRYIADLVALLGTPGAAVRSGHAALEISSVGAVGSVGAAGVGIAEGWRGTIVHRVELGSSGRLNRVKIVDPSFFNWPALPVALAGAIVPDFPLANKSFNLSYAGNDL